MVNIQHIQERLDDAGGWLFFDHHGRDPIGSRILGIAGGAMVTRRWFYWVPARGEPVKIVHRIEPHTLDALPGRKLEYAEWRELQAHLRATLKGARSVAMQYSPNAALPAVSMVDAGTVDLIRSFGVEVVSSAGLVQYFEARWSPEQYEMHREAGRRVDAVLREAFDRIGSGVRAGEGDEFTVAEFIRRRFRENGLVTDHGPVVAVNAHSGDPHYEPAQQRSAPIRRGDFVLIDLWAKLAEPRAVYYDITWVAVCGREPSERETDVFGVVRGARDSALAFIQRAVADKRTIAGWEADAVAREHAAAAGFGRHFTHRLGHSIGEDIHGVGANLDNFETRDERPLIEGTCFSIEPGIYLPEFGVRSEIDCYIGAGGAAATGPVQQEIVRIQC